MLSKSDLGGAKNSILSNANQVPPLFSQDLKITVWHGWYFTPKNRVLLSRFYEASLTGRKAAPSKEEESG